VDIAIIDSNASPVHAEIRFLKGQRIQIKNLAENFGTLVNGRRVGKAFIKDGDQIDAGDSSFTFRFLEWPESSLVKDDKALAKAKMGYLRLARCDCYRWWHWCL
jgi:pSer/pThr/pTyr-binding forkhead associated (FHA) protein